MRDRRYGASRDVAVAEFLYRHEAEFAAGFLRSAGIPFRLQVDDAGGAEAGVTIGRPAVLWVRREDAEEARDILELDDPESRSALRRGEDDGDAGDPWREADDPAGADEEPLGGTGVYGRRPALDDRPGPGTGSGLERLGRAERLVAGLLALALVGLASAGGDDAVPWVGLWEGAALLLALALGLSAVSGHTIHVLKVGLRALSGHAP